MAQLWSLRGLSWRQLATRTGQKSWEDDVFGQSARLALYFFFGLFPVLLSLFIFLKSAPSGSEWRDAVFDCLGQLLPPDAWAMVTQTVEQLNAQAIFGSDTTLTGLYAAWGALNGTWAIITGLNKAYEVGEERPWWRVVSIMFGLTIVLSVLSGAALTLIVFGNRVVRHLGLLAHLEFIRRTIEWSAIVPLVLLSLAVLYRYAPNLKDRRWQWSNPGAVVGTTLWVASTLLLRFSQAHFHSSQRIYGGVSAVITLLLWLYLTGAAVFVGGEANSEIEKAAAEAGQPDVRKERDSRTGGQQAGA
jgi:membrane protein